MSFLGSHTAFGRLDELMTASLEAPGYLQLGFQSNTCRDLVFRTEGAIVFRVAQYDPTSSEL